MWKLRGLGKLKIIRLVVKFMMGLWFWHGRVHTIKRGPLKGYKWSCNKHHQFWMPLGVYEMETAGWIIDQCSEGSVFFDVGGNAGYFTLIGSKAVGDGQVIVFEPISANVQTIHEHIKHNGCKNICVEEMAVSDESGTIDFVVESNNANSHIAEVKISHAKTNPDQVIQVPMMRLDDYIAEKGLDPNVVKVDVEGAELKVLRGAEACLKRKQASWIISTHSQKLFDDCKRVMLEFGYKVEELEGFHHELICTP